MKIIEKAISILLEKNPFYAHFFLNSTVFYDKYKVPTAAAAVTHKGIVLVFNTKFIEAMPPKEVCAVVEHEVLHILFSHIYAMKHDKTLNKQAANIAMDGSINQWIENIPAEGITVEKMEKYCKKPLERRQHWEYYYGHLMDAASKIPKSANSLDDHEVEIPGQVSESEGKQIIRGALNDAVKAAKGDVPKNVMKLYSDMLAPAQVPWAQVLANFVARATASTSKNTRKKTNRRFGLDQPGKRKIRELTLGVCVDSSGSVSDEMFQLFVAEISRISKLCSVTYIVDADCSVQNVEKVKKGKAVKNERHGGGGTAYQPAIAECKKLRCDAIVYFGDMDSADTPDNPGLPFLWVIAGEGRPPGSFGSTVRLV